MTVTGCLPIFVLSFNPNRIMYIITATENHIARLRKQVDVDRRDRKNPTWRPTFVFLPATDNYYSGGETYAPIGVYVQFYVDNAEPQVEAVHEVLLINDRIQRRVGDVELQWADAAAKRAFDVLLAEWRVEMAESALEDAKTELAIVRDGEHLWGLTLADADARLYVAAAALDAARAELARLQAESIGEKGERS